MKARSIRSLLKNIAKKEQLDEDSYATCEYQSFDMSFTIFQPFQIPMQQTFGKKQVSISHPIRLSTLSSNLSNKVQNNIQIWSVYLCWLHCISFSAVIYIEVVSSSIQLDVARRYCLVDDFR